MARRVAVVLGIVLLAHALSARAAEIGTYRLPIDGRVQAVRAADVNGDGRLDLLVLLGSRTEGGAERHELLVLRTPAAPVRPTFFGEPDRTRIDLESPELAGAGAVGVGRFGPDGGVRLRFFGRQGITDLVPPGETVGATERVPTPTLLSRSPGRAIVFWDAVADLDGDGRDECWFPRGDEAGAIRVLGGSPATDRTLELWVANRGTTDVDHLVRRHAYIPKLVPADLDGDGVRELVAYRSGALVAWTLERDAPEGLLAPAFRLPLPFVKENLGPDEVHTPRLQLEDVDGDGRTDLLVTLVTGNRRQLGSFRTRLLHFPGPFRDAATGELVPPRVRIDTESVALHPHFVDVDGDGRLDYVSDSIRGTKLDMFRRVLGQDPTIWHVAFRFVASEGTFETIPYFSVERPYSREEAVGNRFGLSASFGSDFDGDGHNDLLDLGNLNGVEVLGAVRRSGPGPGDPVGFTEPLLARRRVPSPLVGEILLADLDGDGRADAVLWNEDGLFLLVTGGRP